MKTLLVWLLMPLTALQGLWLKRVATRLPGAAGDRRGECGEGEPMHLLALGDSIIDGVGTESTSDALPVLFAETLARNRARRVHWHVNGKSGLNIDGLLGRLEQHADEKADLVLISIGVNDVTGLSSTRHWRTSLIRLLDHIGTRWPDSRVLFAGLPPMGHFPLLPQPLRMTLGWRADALDVIAAEICATRPRVTHVPTVIDPTVHSFSEDGYHPSSESCAIWAGVLAQAESSASQSVGTRKS